MKTLVNEEYVYSLLKNKGSSEVSTKEMSPKNEEEIQTFLSEAGKK